MKDKRYSEEDVKDWEQLPMISAVLTSSYFGAWLYYRDKRRDKKIESELLDKFIARLKDYFVIPHDVSVIEQMAKEMKGEKEVKHSIEDVKKQDTELLNALDKAKEEAYQKGKVDGAKEFAEGLLENLLLK